MHRRDWMMVLTGFLSALGSSAHAQLEFKADEHPQRLFWGDARKVRVTFHNPGVKSVLPGVRIQLFQATSSTAAPVGEPQEWKQLEVLPGQTVLESATIALPAVKAETRFLVRWIEETNKVLGATEVLAYPLDILKELKALAGDEPPGILDPQNVLKPLLKGVDVQFTDLQHSRLDEYHGKLVILGPFVSKEQVPDGLGKQVNTVAKQGTAVVWLQPPPGSRHKLEPSYHVVPEGQGVVVVAQSVLVANLAENPRAQLNLVELSRLALRPEPAGLPYRTPK